MAEVPELWWSPSDGRTWRRLGDQFASSGSPYREVYAEAVPADAVALVPAEPVDDKGRTPTYLRGEADGWNAARAGAEPHDQGVVHEWTEVHLAASSPEYDFTFRSDRASWQAEPGLVRLARETWHDVTVRTRHVRQVTYSTEWAEQPAHTPEGTPS